MTRHRPGSPTPPEPDRVGEPALPGRSGCADTSVNGTVANGDATTGNAGRVLAPLRAPLFRWWFLAQVLSASGTATQAVGQSWLIVRLTGSGVDLALLTVAIFGPVLLGAAATGALADRVDRGLLLLVTQTAFVSIGATLAALTITGAVTPWMVYATATATGVVNAFDWPARQVYVIDLVGRDRVASAISLYEVVLNTSRVLGPAIGGLFLLESGVGSCFVFNAVSYTPAVLVLLWHRSRLGRRAVPRPPRQPGDTRAGLRYAWTHPAIRACMIMAAAAGALFNLGVTTPLLAVRVFHLGGGGYGAMTAAFGAGALVGALAAAGGPPVPSGPRIRTLAVLTGLAVLATAAAPDVPTVFTGLAVSGFLSIWFIASANTLAQLSAEPAMRGRVMGAWSMAQPGMNPFTGLAAGAVADAAGARAGFGLGGVGFILTALLTWRALDPSTRPSS